jgi:hypothetical protein
MIEFATEAHEAGVSLQQGIVEVEQDGADSQGSPLGGAFTPRSRRSSYA